MGAFVRDTPDSAQRTAKLFMHGRSQAVRLPKEFRLEGPEVRISREGDRVILEPLRRTAEGMMAVFAEIDRLLGDDDFLPGGSPADPPVKPDPRTFFE